LQAVRKSFFDSLALFNAALFALYSASHALAVFPWPVTGGATVGAGFVGAGAAGAVAAPIAVGWPAGVALQAVKKSFLFSLAALRFALSALYSSSHAFAVLAVWAKDDVLITSGNIRVAAIAQIWIGLVMFLSRDGALFAYA
jgi:hypothetical protein